MKTAFWSAQGLTQLTIGLNFASFFLYRNALNDAFDVTHNNTVGAMIVSMFTHLNAEHLVGNMLSLFFTSLSVFTVPQWNSPWAFLMIYVPSGLAGFLGNSLLVRRMQDDLNKRQARNIPSLWTDIWNGKQYRNATDGYRLLREMAAKRIGASGAIYGVVGARIYTAIWSPYHEPLNVDDLRTLLCLVGEEVSQVPWSLDTLSTQSFVDHTAHVFGFVTGMVTAYLWDTWSTYRQRLAEKGHAGSGKRGSSS
jgi:membrane associated rhomboid family serine protease